MDQSSGSGLQKQETNHLDEGDDKFDYTKWCTRNLSSIQTIKFSALLEAAHTDTVAGHGGILTTHPSHCLKPINPLCLRSRREQLFYQMVRYFQANQRNDLYYKDFPIFINPKKSCDCKIDWETFRTIVKFMPDYINTKHLITEGEDFDRDMEKKNRFYNQIYSAKCWCPCYGNDNFAKNHCALAYDQIDFICMEDLHYHCKTKCIMDIKMGRITYDPMANARKIHEQTFKYPRLRDFGFRILGMKTGFIQREKDFGKTLLSQEQVFEAIESFFDPLQTCDKKCAVISKMLDILELLLEWMETKNNNQLRLYSSSLLFVYDSSIGEEESDDSPEVICDKLARSVRVRIIDYAHVFHSHDEQEGPSRSGSSTSIRTSESLNKDDNYLYGLRRLVKFFIMLNRQQRVQVSKQDAMKYLSS